MGNFKDSHNIADQSNKKVRKSQKHDANLQKNSSLYFQIGLILCLLGTYGLFETRFEDKILTSPNDVSLLPEDSMIDIKNYVPEKEIPEEKEKKIVEPKVLGKNPKIADDEDPIEDTSNILTEPVPTSKIIDPKSLGEIEKPEDEPKEIFNMVNVEIVPIYPGCEKKTTNNERIKCMSEKLSRLIQRKFDTDLAAELGLNGKQKIDVQFKIDKEGKITDVKARAPHPQLKKEAERLTTKIPVMKPGLQRAKPVSVIYHLPIIFQVQN